MADPKPTLEKQTISKKEAVRRAMAQLGNDAGRTQIKAFIKDTFNIEMSPDHISTTKGELLRQSGKPKASPARPGGAKAAPARKAAPAAAAAGHTPAARAKGIQLADVLALHALVRRVGAEQLRTLIDVVGKG